MEKRIKTKELLQAYRVLAAAKYGKLDDAEKISLWKIARAMRPVAVQFETDVADLTERMKPEGYDEDLLKAQSYERALKTQDVPSMMLPETYNQFIVSMQRYRKLVDKAVREMAEAEVTLCFDGISEETFSRLMDANDWTMEQVMNIDIIIDRV